MSIVTKFWSQLTAPGPTPFLQRFNSAVETAATSIDKWVSSTPSAATLAAEALSDVKQGVSTALALADSDPAVQGALNTALGALETLVDGGLTALGMRVAGPAGATEVQLVAAPLVNTGLGQFFQVLHSALNTMETEAKAWAGTPTTVGNVTVAAPGA